MKNRSALILLLPLLALDLRLWTLDSSAQSVPALINYQGRLSNPDGSGLPTSDYQLTFNIYDSSNTTSGLIWGPQVFDGAQGQGHGSKIPVVQGYFNVMLGPTDTTGVSLANAFNDTNRFVEIKVGTNSAIKPRQQILTAPFAFNSAKLAGYDWSALLGTNNPVVGTIPFSKLPPRQPGPSVGTGGLAISASSGVFDTSSTAYVDVPNLEVTLVTSGRPVFLGLIPDGDTNATSYVETFRSSSGSADAEFGFSRNDLLLNRTEVDGGFFTAPTGLMLLPPGAFSMLDIPEAGTNRYKFKAKAYSSYSVEIARVKLIAYEL